MPIIMLVLSPLIAQCHIQIGKEEFQLSLFADDIIPYIGGPKDSTKTLSKLRAECGKVAGETISSLFVYTDNGMAEKGLQRPIPFT